MWGAAAVALTAVLAAFGALLTGLAVGVDGGGFSAQSGRSPTWAALDELLGVDLARFVPSSALPGQGVLFAVWGTAAVAFGIAVRVRCGRRVSPPDAAPAPLPVPAAGPG
jgi:hypothetical protein